MRRFELASGREVELLADVLGEPTVKVRDVQTKQEFSMWRKDVARVVEANCAQEKHFFSYSCA